MTSPEALPKISIITPTFNGASYLPQTINSVLSQDYPDLEYLVVDGGSTDETLDILKSYGDRLGWISEKDRGQSHAINKGLQRVSGEVIAYLNSDDLYEPGALLKVGEYFRRRPQARWVSGRCRFIDPQGKEIRRLVTHYKNFWLGLGSFTALMMLDYVSQPATFWHREAIERVGSFDESLYYTMDYDFSLRVGRHFKLHALPHTLAAYRIHTCSKTFTSEAAIDSQFAEDLAIAARHGAPRLITSLHALHNALITRVYRGFARASTQSEILTN